MARRKIVMVGAGSIVFCKMLLSDIMATPVLAGAVACLLQTHPGWTMRQLKEALFESGDFFRRNRRFDPLFIRGFGVPNLARAAGLEEGPPR